MAKEKIYGLAVAGFIVSLVGLLLPLAPLIGLILSIVALTNIKRDKKLSGRGFAIAGTIIGAVLLVMRLISVVFVFYVLYGAPAA